MGQVVRDSRWFEGRWAAIEAKLQQAKPQLINSGWIIRRYDVAHGECWILRYRERVDGRIRHGNIFIGAEMFANRARALIERWRTESVTYEDHRRASLRRDFELIARCRGYSGRARQRLREALDGALGDHVAERRLALVMEVDDSAIRCGKQPGPRAQHGLW